MPMRTLRVELLIHMNIDRANFQNYLNNLKRALGYLNQGFVFTKFAPYFLPSNRLGWPQTERGHRSNLTLGNLQVSVKLDVL